MKLTITHGTTVTDVTQIMSTCKWSGERKRCCRTVEATLLADRVAMELGDLLQLFDDDGAELFEGYLVTLERSSAESTIDLYARDRGIYLNNNQITTKAKNTTPEAVAASVCSQLGIPVGTLAATNWRFSRIFSGVTAYDAIMTGYTLAGAKNKKTYILTFSGGKLSVTEQQDPASALVVQSKSNLQDAVYRESIESLVNSVEVRDKNDKVVRTVQDADSIALYGVMRRIVKQSGKDDKDAEADKILKENKMERSATVNCLGDTRLVTGGAVIVHEEKTGLNGLFYIEGDTHQWRNNVYTCKLTLAFERIMDERTAGSEK